MMIQNKVSEEKYYDPEIVSLLVNIVASLGGIATIIGTGLTIIQYNDYIKENHSMMIERNNQRESIREEIRDSLYSLSTSVDNIRYDLKELEHIYMRGKRTPNNSTMQFGNGLMMLDQYQFMRFHQIQHRIIKETQKINSNLKLIEELLLTGEDHSLIENYGANVKARHVIVEATTPINRLLGEFGNLEIEDFMDKAIKICYHIGATIERLEENLKTNYD